MITQGEAIDIPVTVSDENGDALNLTGAGLTGYSLPNFVTFTDNGNGTGVFHLAPGGNTVVGDYTIYLTATEQRSYAVGEEHSTIGNFLVTVNAGVGNIPDVVTPPVVRAVNHRPNLTPLPLQLGYENRSITFELKGNDGDGDALVYTIDQVTKDEIIVAIPKGAFINPNTGKFVWNTDYNQAGHYNFKFSTLDPSGLQDTKDVVVWIENVNRSPLFEPSNRAVALGKELKFLLGGSDPDLNGVLTYKAIDLPTGASLDSNTGEFKWTPDASQVGVHNVSFTVSDGEETVKRIVTIKVRNQIVAPKLSIDLTLGFPVLPGQRVIVNALADSEADIAGFKVVVDGQEINTFQPNATRNGGSFTFISNQTGRHNLSITVTDLDGRVSQLDRVIKVRDGADILAPIVQFEPGLDGSQITTVTKLLGKVSDSNLDEWRLEIATLGTESYRQLNGGSGSVNGLGDLDPGTLTNGFYQLRLTAVDISGRQSVTTSVVEINSSSKSGYQSQATDLVTSLAGVEVKLQRFYSPAQGWRFGLDSDIQLSNGSTSQALAVGTRLYLTTPAGERVGFTFTPEQRQIAGLTYYVPKWTADQGVNYQLESAAAQLSLAGSRFYDVGTGVPYNPSSAGLEQYTLGAAGGVKYLLNSQYGVVGQVGANGARLIYSDSGIVANNGDAVEFVNDAAGRLSQVRSNNGANLTYSYDLQGNLGSVRGFGQQQFYGYEAGVLRSIVGAVGQPGVLIENGVTRAISQNLGGVSSFNGKTINAVAGESYGFSIALGASGAIGARELKTAKEQRVLISVAGDAAIKGLVPVEVHDGFRVYGIDRAATYVVEAAGAFTLAVVGDVNLDGRVDGLDSQLVTTAGIYDVNGDKAFSEKDLQLLAGNFGFVGNQAPVITPVTSLTHVDLTTRIALDSLVTDPDGDLVTFGVQDGANGHVELSVDGRYVLFTPNVGFSGTGNFELLASDGLGLSQKQITVNVSDAALVNLDIVNRNPKLQVGDKYQLQVIGDFADQKGVALLRDYVQYGVNTAAVSIDNLGLIRAISDGVGIISASRNGISAVTATRVGIFNPVTDVDVVIAKAENYGLDVYPGAVTLIPGMERQILVTTLDGSESSNALTASATGTKYFVSNPNIVDVSAEGLITVKQTGVANVTVINQGAEFRMALQVELPRGNYSSLNVSGGAIKASDGAVVTIAPGALSKDTVVSIQQIAASEVSQLLPPDYDFVGAFKLNVGDDELITSAQIAINAPKDLAVGTEVFFLQKGEIPNEQGELVPIWFMEESGRVGADGMIRTSSPPWNGVKKTGEFVVAVPTFTYSAIEVSVFISKVAALHAGALFLGALSGIASVYFNSYSVVSGGLLKNLYGKAVGKIDDVFYGSIDILTRIPLILGKFANALNNPPVSVLTVPTYGLPYTTTANVEINPGQLPTVKAEINAQAAGDYQPVVNSVELQTVDVNGGVQPVLFLGGQNFGNSLSQLQVDLISATGEVINLQVIDSLSTSTKIAVKPTNLLPINSHGHLQVTRNYQTAYQPTVTKFKSNLANLPDEPLYKSVSLVPQAWGNSIAVFNTTNPTDVINTSQVGSPDLLLAKIPVGIAAAGTSGGPRYVAATSDGTVAYTPLESQGRVAVVDLLALQQVNTNRGASDPTIALPTGAQPFSIVIDHLDRYAYVADRRPANGVGKIYVIDINPNSATYNKHIKTISIGTNLVELAQMAVSADGKSLFITAPKATDSQGHVLVVNIDASRKNAPSSQWQKQVADIVTKQGVTGVAVAPLDANHPERVQMAITNRQQDFNGFGVITIDNGNFAQAQTTYTKLSLGSVYDYFDVNEAFSTTITQDGKYAFVAARNTANLAALIPSVDADNRAGSNIGIIKDPLTSNAKLIAATLPIPMGWTIGLALSGDDKVLTAAYQGLGPSPGTVFMFNVDEIIRTIEHPEQFYIADPRGENEKSPNLRPHVASLDDFQYYAIDAINPAIGQIAADLYRTGSGQQIDFIVPEGSKTPPIYIGNNTYSVTNTSDWLDLDAVTPVGYTEDLTPTLNWHFANAANVQEVNLFVSTFDQGEGLLPWDELVNLDDSTFLPNLSRQQKENLLSKDWHGYHDYNPGRTLTATWKKNTNSWYWADGTVITQNASSSSNTTFTLPDVVSLATGTNYHWAVQASDNSGRIIVEKGDFDTVAPLGNSPFSSVSILTQGFTQDPTPTGVSDWVYGVGNAIINSTGTAAGRHGLLLLFEKRTGTWLPVDSEGKELTLLTGGLSPRDPNYLSTLAANIKTYYQHKPLVLMSEWSLGRESVVVDSGFSEGAADDIFAAMVHLDQALGGGVGNQAGEIYDQQGRLIVTQGDLFNSPLHFIGHSRGTVVTSEIVQRTYFPGAGGRILLDAQGNVIDNPDRDLQMTTLDPHDFRQPSLANFQDFYEPKIQIWDNITFADNYYQTLGFENGATFTPNGRDIPNLPSAETNRNPQPAGLNFLRDAQGRLLGQPDFSLNMNNLTGFFLNPDNQSGAPHSEVVNWYEGTVDLNLDSSGGLDGRISDTPGDLIKTIYDRLGEREVNDLLGTATSIIPWFKREGAGQGWYYSVLGGGKAARPHSNVAKVPVSWDNTLEARLRGDFAVPTLFNGNFNASFESPPSVLNPVSSSTFRNFAPKVGSTAVPGWSFRNNVSGATWNDNAASTWNLVDWKDIPTFAQPNGYLSKLGIDPSANTYQPDYAIKLDSTNNTITHNRFLIPDWGSLRFDLFTGAITSPMAGTLKVFLDALDGSTATKIDEIYLERAVGTGAQYERDTHKIGYGELGFETFTVDIPDAWRGKVGTLRFELDNSTQPIYLDNMFFKSQPLLLGNPTVARNQDTLSSGINNYENNYLIEKSQFAISYSKDDNIPNWSAWELNKSWIGTEDRRVPFFGDPALQNQGWIQVTDSDYKRDYGIEYGNPGYVPKSDLPQINPEPDSNGVIKPYKLAPGHLSPVLHRSRIRKDVTSTFLSTNVVPQFDKLNSPVWSGIEDFERNLVDRNANNRELYIYSGSVGTKQDKPSINITDKSAPYNIRVPEALWRVIVVMDRPGLGIADINSSNTHAFALIASNELPTPGQTPFDPWYINGNIILTSVSDLEEYLNNDLTNEARSITYNFLSNLPTNVRNAIKSQTFPILPSNGNPVNAFLLAETSPSEVITNAAIWHDRVLENVAIETVNFFELDSSQVGIAQNIIPEQSPFEIGSHQISLSQIATTDFSIPKFSINQGGVSQVDTEHGSVRKSSPSQISPTEVSSIQTNGIELSSNQNSTAQVDSFHVGVIQVQSTKVDITKVGLSDTITKVSQPRPTEIPLTSSITLQQFLSSHNFDLQNRTVPLWTEFLQSPTPFNLKVETTDLPTGQLAEGTITGYDTNGRPNSGTITLDINGNNQGWFIDTTPGDNSEFDEQLTETAYQATNSPATGKYDLFTVILHELGHLQGIIKGNSAFDANVKNNTFIGTGFTATLTADGSHLDNTLYPYDLLNTSLKPGIRKLPSQLDLAIINQLYSTPAGQNSTQQNPNAALTAGALYAIENGDFINTSGWNLQGGTTISNGAATLSEASQKLAQLTQDLIIPAGAKRLQFTIKDNHLVLGDSSKTANDAFEVALLGTNFKPLAGTSQGLNNTDSLLNIQANGTTYKSNKVTITSLSPTSQIVSIDLTEITPETQATLYFNLLGFGARTSTVTIDDIKIFSAAQPIANPDNIVTNQATPIIIDPTTNDSNVVGIQIIDRPTHGNLSQDQNGQIVYQPDATYVGTDRFTYIGFNNEGSISNQGIVDITVNNVPPSIESITVPPSIIEGEPIELIAIATDNGNSENLTYSWNLGDGTTVQGQQVSHTFTNNGIYQAILTVTDKDGGVTEKAIELKVANAAPSIVVIDRPTQIKEGQPTQFKATATDSGINDTLTVTDKDGAVATQTVAVEVDNVLPSIINIVRPTQVNEGQAVEFSTNTTDAGIIDTLTYSWSFGDGSAPVTGQTINHTFADNGTYNAVLTVTDKDGGVSQQAIEIKVDNVAPVIILIEKPAQISEGQTVEFKATAIDGGITDSLTYSWNFGDNTNAVIGQNATHTFADNGNYNVVLTVTDKDGAVTTQTTAVKIDNVAPIISSITVPASVIAGTSAQFTAIATDAGIKDTLTYSWNFGGGSSALIGQNSSHVYAIAGTYNIILTVSDNNGANSTQIKTLTVTAPATTGGIRAGGKVSINGNPALNNVKLIANTGNINLSFITANNLAISAAGSINLKGNTKLGGTSILNSNGSTIINGKIEMSTSTSNLKVIAQSDIAVSGTSTIKGQLITKKNVSLSGNTTLVDSIDALLNVSISGNTTVVAQLQAPVGGCSNDDSDNDNDD